MKCIVSLILGGLLITSSLTAQNPTNNSVHILDQVSVVSSTSASAEDIAARVSSRESFLMQNATADYSTSIWSRDIYRQLSKDVEGNETFFAPDKSTDTRVNMFSMLINLVATKKINVYTYKAQPDMSDGNAIDAKDVLADNLIPYTDGANNAYIVRAGDVPSDKVLYYLVKEKWSFDSKTFKGDARVTHICPVLLDKGKFYPLFWVSFDDVSAHMARVASPLSVSNIEPVLTNVSMFDVIRSRYYRGCIYQVGLRPLSSYFPVMKDLIEERKRIENELDYIQDRFYAAERRR